MPEGVTLTLIVVLGLAVAFDYINGFHDTANAIATSVSTRALKPGYAIAMSATANFAGALTGTAVAETVGAGLVKTLDRGSVACRCGKCRGRGRQKRREKEETRRAARPGAFPDQGRSLHHP